MNVTTVTFGEKNGSFSFDRHACLHHPLVWTTHLIDRDSFIFLCDRHLAVSANRAGNHIHDHDLLFEHTKNRAQPIRRRIGGASSSALVPVSSHPAPEMITALPIRHFRTRSVRFHVWDFIS